MPRRSRRPSPRFADGGGLRARADGKQSGRLSASLVRFARRKRSAHRRRSDHSDRAQFDRLAGRERSIGSPLSNRIPWRWRSANNFSSTHPRLKRIAAEDTAGSVREVVRAGDPTRAAIAGKRAAELYGAVFLREHLEDDRENYTRFFLLAPTAGQPQEFPACRQNLARLSASASARSAPPRAGAFRAPQYQHDENRKPPRARPSVAIPFLSGPAGRGE